MNEIERREEIMRILIIRRHETMQVLADELGVTDRTIRNDITILTDKYPLKTIRGVGGGVSIPDSFMDHSQKRRQIIRNGKKKFRIVQETKGY